jgi:two-component system OmpR family sensor kinase/two-component system sensor histidine kinase CpxA
MDAQGPVIENLDRIDLETNRINEMIAEILLLAKLDVERHPEQWQATDLIQVVNQVVQDAHFEQQSENIEIHFHEKQCLVMASDKLLSSAVENLIRNALLHTFKGTKVEITIKSIEQTFALVIRDHGPGVPDEHIPNLTKPFYRAEQSRERINQDVKKNNAGSRGYGLGMAIANRVIKSFDGHMDIRNHPEGGLEISCYLNKH